MEFKDYGVLGAEKRIVWINRNIMEFKAICADFKNGIATGINRNIMEFKVGIWNKATVGSNELIET